MPTLLINIGVGIVVLLMFAPTVGDITIASAVEGGDIFTQTFEKFRGFLIPLWVLAIFGAAVLQGRGPKGLTGVPVILVGVAYVGVFAAFGDDPIPMLIQGLMMAVICLSVVSSSGGGRISDILRLVGAAVILYGFSLQPLPGGALAPLSLITVFLTALAPVLGGLRASNPA